ncbi:MAG: NAD(+)/NADH kinase [Lachnospiraceae bacterium]|nr:NAD(+)/NADH kinase [Lachnospiraceae bacterium]
MKKFCVISNSLKDPGLKEGQKVCQKIAQLVGGEEVPLLDVCEEELPVAEGTEALLVLGGDGTLLSVAIRLRKLDIPMLGINLGHVGYLAEVEAGEVEGAIKRILNDEFVIEDRMMLAGLTSIGGEKSELEHALNDIVLSRHGDLQVASYRIYVNDVFLYEYSGDGIIISTPTGSTGYNLSAAGPIVEPSASLLVLTPICPHTLNTRSIVLSDEGIIRVELLPGRSVKEAAAGTYFDGVPMGVLSAGDYIEVRKSKRVCRFIKLGSDGFLQVLRKKLVN